MVVSWVWLVCPGILAIRDFEEFILARESVRSSGFR